MDCPDGCLLESDCDNNTALAVFTICIGFIGVCGGLICHIYSLNKRLEENINLTDEEVPPSYQAL